MQDENDACRDVRGNLEWIEIPGGVTAPAGFLAGGLHCGIKKNGNPDLAIIFSERPTTSAGMFTRNIVKAAPVLYSQKVMARTAARAIVANSGNANAVTGERGMLDAEAMARTAAASLGLAPDEVAVASTGAIGQPLPIEKVVAGIKTLAPSLSRAGGDDAARAIMTTDTHPKTVAIKTRLSKGEITIGGAAKGVGMICPDLATLLVFITTDARIEGAFLWRALRRAVEDTFNSMTVDGDMSTNDTVIAMANGASNAPVIDRLSDDYCSFHFALQHVCARLAEMLIKDGEGATKLIRVNVFGAVERTDAHKIAKTIANSMLVKTAIFGNDANWGRIIAAAGRAGVKIDPDIIDISLDDLVFLKAGRPQNFDETRARELLSKKELTLTVDLHSGSESATVLTCDLSYDYVKINASYRT
jgi:glutamate N-acetyltransferase/amino-acid N-acetyltransferase